MMTFHKITAAFCMTLFGVSGQSAGAQSPNDAIVSAELLSGWQTADGTRMSALHLVLAPGWKTYWRIPGESGIPPSFDWRGSENVGAVAYHWPKPVLFDLNGYRTIGYHDDLMLPIEIRPAHKGQSVSATTRIDLGVCKDICVPVTLDLSLHFDGDEKGRTDPAISAALADAPEPASAAGVTAATCQAEPIRDGIRLSTRLTIPALGGEEFAVVELSDRTVWVSDSETRREGSDLLSVADMVPDNAQPFAVNRSAVRITVFGGSGRVVDVQGCAG